MEQPTNAPALPTAAANLGGSPPPPPSRPRKPRRMARDSDTAPPVPADAAPLAPASKIAQVVDLLGRAEGATLAELIATTGWLAHTTRAALTGLKKKGHVIERGKRDEATCYRIVGPA